MSKDIEDIQIHGPLTREMHCEKFFRKNEEDYEEEMRDMPEGRLFLVAAMGEV